MMKHAEIRSFDGSNLAGDAKGNKKGFLGSYEHTGSKRPRKPWAGC